MQEIKMCPYPGLRPFNDDESIFFKGRDGNIATIIELFEKKKFMMLTGASGDGKSSLVYAGVVPNARAGLFKAKYNNWAIADFRPERSPLDNLAKSLNKFFSFDNPEALKKELSYGFSSLVNIYKKSSLYIDAEGKEWKEADDAKKKLLKRKASNLLIIADQFEEFFTNTENYNNGIASVESQTVIHLLLETAKAALAEDIPIYIICTMRSDYIGQCAAFRGLPEYIGFSQFFVPRLKRNEISQVIEEPAFLNGDKISRRLAERLLNDITEGYDQLPILQHALNHIWKIANKGAEEMDLIHYAMVGGLPKNQLPLEDQSKFENWFNQLPEFKKQLFAHPSLENILNAHADELLETAHDKYTSNNLLGTEGITKEETKLIVKTTFQCLTKIDDARAVRNRMTLQEIADIIHQPHIESEIVGKVLDIFREQGNTFIKPFITEDPETHKTKKNTVLDITHESLIRNWDILKTWADEESENLLTWQDFYKQLQRWVKSGKTKGYLLPIGPLTFFETWYNTCKPNKYWLARYDERDISFEGKTKSADEALANARQFIKRSANALFVSRTVMKYGANRIATYFSLLVLMISCTYYYFDYRRKQNDYVIKDITEKGMALLHSDKIKIKVKANFLTNQERLHPGTTETLLNSLSNDTLAYDIAFEDFGLVQNYDAIDEIPNPPLVHRLIVYMDSSLTEILHQKKYSSKECLVKNIDRINNYLKLCAYISYYKNSTPTDKIIKKYLQYLGLYIDNSLETPGNIKVESFKTSIELLLTLYDCKKEQVDILLNRISPFNEASRSVFEKIYPKDEKIKVDWQNYLSHKGGYQTLSYLYAITGDYNNLNRCLDSITKNNKDYKNFQFENINNIFYYLTKYQDFPNVKIEAYVKKYLDYSSAQPDKFYYNLTSSFPTRKLFFYNIHSDWEFDIEPLMRFFLPKEKVEKLWDYYFSCINNSKKDDINERNLNIALFYKKRGIYETIQTKDQKEAEKYFTDAFAAFKKLPETFLGKDFNFRNASGEKNMDATKVKNAVIFLCPHLMNEDGWNNVFVFTYFNRRRNYFPFFNYIIEHKMQDVYKTEDALKSLEEFIYNYFYTYQYALLQNRERSTINYDYFHNIVELINKNPNAAKILNKSFIKLMAMNHAFEQKDTTTAFSIYRGVDTNEIFKEDFQKLEQPRDAVHKGLLKELAQNLALYNRLPESFKIIKALKDPWDRRNTLIDICYELQRQGPIENTFVYLDSLFTEVEKKPKFGMKLFWVTGMVGSQSLFDASMNLFKDVDDKVKPRGMNNFIRGIAYEGLYHRAYIYIPKYVSHVNELELYNEILHAEIIKEQKKKMKNELQHGDTLTDYKNVWSRYEEKTYGEHIPENYEWEKEHFSMFEE